MAEAASSSACAPGGVRRSARRLAAGIMAEILRRNPRLAGHRSAENKLDSPVICVGQNLVSRRRPRFHREQRRVDGPAGPAASSRNPTVACRRNREFSLPAVRLRGIVSCGNREVQTMRKTLSTLLSPSRWCSVSSWRVCAPEPRRMPPRRLPLAPVGTGRGDAHRRSRAASRFDRPRASPGWRRPPG